ncbi:hypothetical protein JDV02_003329 [Purpureocillium takamizusanense]|uniref:Uncharacterized protein n=1 Tax=Purpureocillium takamizusanense TaxID=2060973 RepID=A0A9Q8QCX1_9HYPO|nr:uncharacterized protein JDV02_003329 [Purpureocillium takamizusanense]UNI16947.1 hypothetical protein JDV02_003329 [Purpureocillium takamizusanense]
MHGRRSWLHEEDPSQWLTITFVPDSSQGDVIARGLGHWGPIEHIPNDHVTRSWDRSPYNQRVLGVDQRPSSHESSGIDTPGTTGGFLPSHHKPMDRETLARNLDLEPEELSPFLDRHNNWKNDISYRIVGSTATLIRRAWGWRVTVEDDDKLLMAHTLHDPEWADVWDQHFEDRGEPNLRKWERYGALARHRRERAAHLGVEEWRVVPCGGNGGAGGPGGDDGKVGKACEWGCGTMKTAKVVTDYLKKARAKRLYADSDDEE